MRYQIEVPDELTFRTVAEVIQATQNMEEVLGLVRIENVALGMQHQLGMVSALTMAGIDDNIQELGDHLLGLAGLALIYLKALSVKKEQETLHDDGQEGT